MLRTKAKRSDVETPLELHNRDVAYRAAIEAIVLLENDGALPITSRNVALFGAGATHTTKGGTGSGEVNERCSINIKEGLEHAQLSITTSAWINDYQKAYTEAFEAHGKWVSKKLRIPTGKAIGQAFTKPFAYPQGRAITDQDIDQSNTDTCIYVIARQAGEGTDRKPDNGDNCITETERANLEKCAAAYENFIVVINVGASFDVGFMDDIPGINALIFFAQQGSEGGRALADIVTGKVNPSGKLTDTWAQSYAQIPFSDEYSFLNGDVENEQYQEGIYVGYRYFDTFGVVPRYAFGFGRSYSTFDIEARAFEVKGEEVHIEVSVSNSGDHAGKEVVQIYVSCPQTGLDKPLQQLAGFAKTQTLKPGESQSLSIAVNLRYLASFSEAEAAFILDAGEYVFRIGNSSRDNVAAAVLELSEQVIVSKHDSICKQLVQFEELKPKDVPHSPLPQEIVRLSLSADAFKMVHHQYADPEPVAEPHVDQILEKLTREDLIDLVVGTGIKGIFFGEGHFVAPGAVGQTTSSLVDKGLINAPLADGPAGLRLQKRSVFTRKGTAKMVDPFVEAINFFPGYVKKFLFGNPKKSDVYYQYATAFPVALALGQTWNEELINEVGQAIGAEMLEYGIVFWLGPGMNLHRNPLCGRNFEYYSEDPLLSGRLAAAVTRGCQSRGGVYATIKHFVANNQEANRFFVSANVSERTLRELYLRGFEIAVREGAPKAVMTAYNKINGVYASNSHDLIAKVLRSEWGFKGVVMTDWMATRKGCASNAEAMLAGNDLLMPGGKAYKKSLLSALEAGTISDEDVRKCARNIVRAIVESALAQELMPVR